MRRLRSRLSAATVSSLLSQAIFRVNGVASSSAEATSR